MTEEHTATHEMKQKGPKPNEQQEQPPFQEEKQATPNTRKTAAKQTHHGIDVKGLLRESAMLSDLQTQNSPP